MTGGRIVNCRPLLGPERGAMITEPLWTAAEVAGYLHAETGAAPASEPIGS